MEKKKILPGKRGCNSLGGLSPNLESGLELHSVLSAFAKLLLYRYRIPLLYLLLPGTHTFSFAAPSIAGEKRKGEDKGHLVKITLVLPHLMLFFYDRAR